MGLRGMGMWSMEEYGGKLGTRGCGPYGKGAGKDPWYGAKGGYKGSMGKGTGGKPTVPGFAAGVWECYGCGFVNFRRREACGQCGVLFGKADWGKGFRGIRGAFAGKGKPAVLFQQGEQVPPWREGAKGWKGQRQVGGATPGPGDWAKGKGKDRGWAVEEADDGWKTKGRGRWKGGGKITVEYAKGKMGGDISGPKWWMPGKGYEEPGGEGNETPRAEDEPGRDDGELGMDEICTRIGETKDRLHRLRVEEKAFRDRNRPRGKGKGGKKNDAGNNRRNTDEGEEHDSLARVWETMREELDTEQETLSCLLASKRELLPNRTRLEQAQWAWEQNAEKARKAERTLEIREKEIEEARSRLREAAARKDFLQAKRMQLELEIDDLSRKVQHEEDEERGSVRSRGRGGKSGSGHSQGMEETVRLFMELQSKAGEGCIGAKNSWECIRKAMEVYQDTAKGKRTADEGDNRGATGAEDDGGMSDGTDAGQGKKGEASRKRAPQAQKKAKKDTEEPEGDERL